MKRITGIFIRQLFGVLVMVLLFFLLACGSSSYSAPNPSSVTTPDPKASPPVGSTPATISKVGEPTIKIISPFGGSTIAASDIKISVAVGNINLVDKKGQTSVEGEGHIHYFMDVDVPTAPDKPAVTAAGTYAASSATEYLWSNVTPAEHTFSVELVSNDHKPFNPPKIASVKVITTAADTTSSPAPAVTSSGTAVTLTVSAQSNAFDKNTLTVPAGARVTIVFNNKESVSHNIAVYKTQAATEVIFKGEIIGQKTVNYQFTAPSIPGTYFFRCDVHPTAMRGNFVVTS